MDEAILGKYYRLWRLIRGLQLKDVPKEIENKAKANLALWARELGIKAPITVIKPEFLPELEKALDASFKKGFLPSLPPLPPELSNLIEAHQKHLAKKIEGELKKAGESTVEEQVEKAHQHRWEGVEKTGETDFFQREKTRSAALSDFTDPVEPEIPENELIQERVYHLLRKENLLDEAGQPRLSAWKGLSQAKKIALQEELGPLLHFNELATKYSTQAYWALEATPDLLFYPERHRRLAIKLGRNYAQRVNDQFYKTHTETLGKTGSMAAAQTEAQKTAEDLTIRLFEEASGVEDAVKKIFKPLNLTPNERAKLIGQIKKSLLSHGSRYLNPVIPINRRLLQSLVPNLPKEVFLDVDENNLPRIQVRPLGHPERETTYWAIPTEEGAINQTIQALKGPFGAEAIYLKNQIEYFATNPIGGTISLTVIDPIRGALEALVPGAKWAHLKYIDYTFKKGELLRKIYITPELNYRFWTAVKRRLGGRLGLYKEAFYAPGKSKPVFSPLAWLGQSSSAPFRRGANYFFGRSQKSKSLFMKRFWFGLSRAFRRREQDWDRSPLVLLLKLGLDLTVGTVARLTQRLAFGQLAKVWTSLTETSFGKRFLGAPAIRGLRMTVSFSGQFARSFFSFNTLSGTVLGYAVGEMIGFPQLGIILGGGSGHFYQFWLDIGKNDRWLAWLREPSTHFTSKWIRRIVGKPAIWLTEHPYARFPIKGLALGYVLYTAGLIPLWAIPIPALAQWAWATREWWWPFARTGLSKIPGFLRFLNLLAKLGRIPALLGRFIPWLFPIVTTSPLIMDLLSGTPPLIALQNWFSGPLYLGQFTLIDVAFLTRPLWWPTLKAGLISAINFIIPDAVAYWLYETIPMIVATITSASILTLAGIGLLALLSVFTLYVITSAFFVEQAIRSHVISPELPIEKTVTPVFDQNGEIIALDYTLTYSYNPEDEAAGLLGNIQVFDRFEEPGFVSLIMLYDPDTSTFSPCDPTQQPSSTHVSNTFAWTQEECSQLGPLSPGGSQTITIHLALRDPPLSNYLQGEEMLCDNLTVMGTTQSGKNLSSSSPPVCINAAGETWIFGWPTCYHDCSSNYGWRADPLPPHECEFHEGIDIPPDGCTDIHPATRGVIAQQGYHSGYGCYVIIQHRENLYTLYGHLEDEFRCNFPKNEGDEVSSSDIIGIMDDSGRSTGTHLHFGVSSCGTISCFLGSPEDPCNYLPGCPQKCLFKSYGDCSGSPIL